MKTALVTGANKGIGYKVARQLARKGFHLFVSARNREAGRKAADEIAKDGGKATFLKIDVADNASITPAARELSKIADYLDILVNNAGIMLITGGRLTFCQQRHDRVARRWSATKSHRQILARSERNSLVKVKRITMETTGCTLTF